MITSISSVQLKLLTLLVGQEILLSRCDFQIFEPQNFAAVDLEDEGSLTILFTTNQTTSVQAGLIIKVDVMGFADPTGWPYTKMSLIREDYSVRGSVRLSGLVPGAAKIRLRLLTPDGTDAVGDQALELFLDASRQVFSKHHFPPPYSSLWDRLTRGRAGSSRPSSAPSRGCIRPSAACTCARPARPARWGPPRAGPTSRSARGARTRRAHGSSARLTRSLD